MTQLIISYRLSRDVTVNECKWLDRDLKKDEIVYKYNGNTYGVCTPFGTACCINGPDVLPFYEIPNNALIIEDLED